MTDDDLAKLRRYLDGKRATMEALERAVAPSLEDVERLRLYGFATRLLDEVESLRELAQGVATLKDEWHGSEIAGAEVGSWAYSSQDVAPLVDFACELLGTDKGATHE